MLRRRYEADRQEILLPLAVLAVVLVGGLLLIRHLLWGSATVENEPPGADEASVEPGPSGDEADSAQAQETDQLRTEMVEQQLVARGIHDRRVLDAMGRVPRHKFVPERVQHLAYRDSPLAIGHRQTISQPFIVAMMNELIRPAAETRALDVGTGSGYQAAILGELVDSVYSIEILEPLADEARELLRSMGYDNIEVRCGDGYRGWPEQAPFDAIIVAAAPDHVPEPLVEQLAPGGRLVIPVGEQRRTQNLLVIEKRPDGTISRRNVTPVAFVPMTGEAQEIGDE